MGKINKHEGIYLMSVNHKKENGMYRLTIIEIAKAQKKDHQIYSKTMQKHQNWINVFILLET